jgi:hypothetical protein
MQLEAAKEGVILYSEQEPNKKRPFTSSIYTRKENPKTG